MHFPPYLSTEKLTWISACMSAAYSILFVEACMFACLPAYCISASPPACQLPILFSVWVTECLLVSLSAHLSATYTILGVNHIVPACIPLYPPVCCIFQFHVWIPKCLLVPLSLCLPLLPKGILSCLCLCLQVCLFLFRSAFQLQYQLSG